MNVSIVCVQFEDEKEQSLPVPKVYELILAYPQVVSFFPSSLLIEPHSNIDMMVKSALKDWKTYREPKFLSLHGEPTQNVFQSLQ